MQNVDYRQTYLFEYYPVFVRLFLVGNWGCQGHLCYLLNYKEVLQTNFLVVLFCCIIYIIKNWDDKCYSNVLQLECLEKGRLNEHKLT